MKKDNTAAEAGVKKETTLLLVFIALVIGFLGGVVYSAYKTEITISAPGDMPPHDHVDESHIKALEEIVAKDPARVDAWTELGNHFFDSSQFEKAIKAYRKVLEMEPKNANVWTDLGVMYRRNGQPDNALAAFKKAQEIDPRHEVSLFNAGVVLMHDLKKPREARAMWEKLVQLNPSAKSPSGQPVMDLLKNIQK